MSVRREREHEREHERELERQHERQHEAAVNTDTDASSSAMTSVASTVVPIVAPMLLMQGIAAATSAVWDAGVAVKHAIAGKSTERLLSEYAANAESLSMHHATGMWDPGYIAKRAANIANKYAGTPVEAHAVHLAKGLGAADAATAAVEAAKAAKASVPEGAGGQVLGSLVRGVQGNPAAVAVVALLVAAALTRKWWMPASWSARLGWSSTRRNDRNSRRNNGRNGGNNSGRNSGRTSGRNSGSVPPPNATVAELESWAGKHPDAARAMLRQYVRAGGPEAVCQLRSLFPDAAIEEVARDLGHKEGAALRAAAAKCPPAAATTATAVALRDRVARAIVAAPITAAATGATRNVPQAGGKRTATRRRR